MEYKGKTLNLVPVNNSDLKVHDNTVKPAIVDTL